jgi:hypothetical protein
MENTNIDKSKKYNTLATTAGGLLVISYFTPEIIIIPLILISFVLGIISLK